MTTATAHRGTVRVTLDLESNQHRQMKLWSVENGPGLALAKIYRALSDELLANPDLAHAVLTRIRGQ
ncbi:hypothetical protein E0H75_42420 [Kribbella capetownensis]|uniref:Uncharacterized protein n=1 Tax=Kribbella capetownensis TaxID=1572659 RepID=A0A4V2M3Y8_9ACTN|nr:hypothetical protein [Kribbella capetownensis]TCC33912.1 hypothetical protein E0H75_42420 [Kribbella capetownensis]